ncbi:MAG: 3-phosphoserine/phosphohydroxythreonine transaminase [Solitalea-like symbiont of Acarus siro]
MKYNFASGPAALPQEVINDIICGINNFKDSKLSILETYHRSAEFIHILENAKHTLKRLLAISDDYEVLFLHGGASLQFLMIPYNFLDAKEYAAFIDTGLWSQKAILQAKQFGNAMVIASSKDSNYKYIPKNFNLEDKDYKYLYLCSNNSVYGTAWHHYPETRVPIVADMTSDLLTKQININQFKLVYASLQKNLGVAGAAVVIINKNFLDKFQVKRCTLDMLNFKTHISSASIYNTPPIFPISVAYLMLNWIEKKGGITFFQDDNLKKATYLYKYIDNSNIFFNDVDKNDRSTTNIVFNIKGKISEQDFIDFANRCNCVGIQGHRSVKGFRVALYNAVSYESVKHLVDAMSQYEKTII